MNKKLLAILLAAVMLLALAACGDEPAPTPDPDLPPVENPDGNNEPQSVLTMFTFMDATPELVDTSWSFIGGCVDGKMMTEDEVAATLSQLDDYYMFYFNDESTVTLYEGADTATTGTYSAANETTVKIEVGGVTYAAVFAEGENGPIMVALLNSTGTNALIFEMVVEG
jgi:lipoprotein